MKGLLMRFLSLATGIAAVTAGAIAGAPAAFAGNNGQLLNVHSGGRTYSVTVIGYNQNHQRWTEYLNTPGPWTKEHCCWWKGNVTLTSFPGYGGGGIYLGRRYPYVPTNYGGTYWKVYAY